MAKKKISKEKSIRRAKHVTELVICAVALASGALIIKGASDRAKPVEMSDFYDKTDIPEETTQPSASEPDPNKIIYENFSVKRFGENNHTKSNYKKKGAGHSPAIFVV